MRKVFLVANTIKKDVCTNGQHFQHTAFVHEVTPWGSRTQTKQEHNLVGNC